MFGQHAWIGKGTQSGKRNHHNSEADEREEMHGVLLMVGGVVEWAAVPAEQAESVEDPVSAAEVQEKDQGRVGSAQDLDRGLGGTFGASAS